MKIKLVHLLTDIEATREKASIQSLSPLKEYGIEYTPRINEIYRGDGHIKNIPIYTGNHGPGHYGLFQSFKRAIEEEFTEDLDGIIICECDCIITVPHSRFAEMTKEAVTVCKDHLINYVSFGAPGSVDGLVWSPVIEEHPNYLSFYLTDKIIMTHCIMFPRHSREYLLRQLKTGTWDGLDIWLNWAFRTATNIPPKRFAVSKETVTYQHEGMSIIEGKIYDGKRYIE
jgi:hypothetical protein